ncbi:MAG: UDP-N-acetylmuramoyl-L-alanine--D-glutamate ligase [Desulfatiglans sp.]|jgi:UDP-N-acetylmuramoylalanine--D-glutamate ligase|nr:UDP-N-acetylmuramoyl-L-alanine--D-glutamate ligase [Thermodesulfobacteriota bacterium]MEE4351296.1 UDP-N-acetylmuramoyl-L-alanine--D-glutamate ligase [Desulfatiglans sp.]
MRDKIIADLAGKKIVVVGLGVSGLWAARWLAGQGADICVSEAKEEGLLDPEIRKEVTQLGIRIETGGHQKRTFEEAEMIVVSPGVPLEMDLIKRAIAENIPVMGELDLAGRIIDIPVIAVTGTNGKTTVTSFLGALLKNAGLKVFVGGNIGTPLIAYAAQGMKADYAVVEVSSFQLDLAGAFCPQVSMILNISADHLDRYKDYEAYVQSKLSIFRNQGMGHYLILNDDDETLRSIDPPSPLTVLRYGFEGGTGRNAFIQEDDIYASLPGKEERSFSLRSFGLSGKHNRANLMAAVLASLALEIEEGAINKTIDTFKGMSDRLERVMEFNGVTFYNDSKATNVDAAVKAVESFDRPIILIAGGRHKGADYAPLVSAARQRVKGAVFLGEAKDILAGSFKDVLPFQEAEDMDQAVVAAFSIAGKGDIVLLAPACSSFDMFTDYTHRGRIFREAVRRLSSG